MEPSKFTIVKKGLVLIALPVVSQLVLLAFLFQLQRDSIDAENWAQHSRQVLHAADAAFEGLAQSQSDVRGLVVTANLVFDQDATAPQNEATDALNTLQTLVADNPPQQRLVEQMQAASKDYVAWAMTVRKLMRDGKQEEAAKLVRDLSGKTLIDSIEAELRTFTENEEKLSVTRREAVERTRTLQQVVLVVATAATLGIAIAMVVLFSKGIAGRLRVLTDNARRLAGGQTLAAPVDGTDEIAELDRVLHDSAAKLNAAADAERDYKQQVEARARELSVVNQELTQKTQENEMFVYSVSHDLRSPLVNLQGFGKELGRSCDDLRELVNQPEMPEPLRAKLLAVIEKDMPDSLRFIQSAVTRSANIIDAMLRLSRAGKLEYRRQVVPIQDIVQRVVDSAAGTSAERAATIDVKPLPDAAGDPTALEQVFANLIVNALNYLDPQRPGKIEIGSVAARPGAEGGSLTYYVKDNGLGIPEAYLHKVFVAFQRLHGDVAKGEGIGLALVRRIVERHGGKIWVESRENVGSTFFVSLLAPDATTPHETPRKAVL